MTNMDQETFERIEAFLQEKLTDGERSRFEERIAREPSLAAEVELQQKLLQVIAVDAFMHKKRAQESHESKTPYFRWMIAATVLLLIAAGGWWLFRQATPSAHRTYTAFFHRDPGLPVTMGVAENYSFYEGMVRYKQGRDQEAIEAWTPLLGHSPENDTLRYFLGSAHLNLQHFVHARKFLQPVAASSGAFRQEALWYLGLINIHEGHVASADSLFDLIPDDPRVRQFRQP